MERVTTGIDGLDKLMEGGFGKGFLIEVAGSAGTFKSTFAVQFAVEGIREKEEVTYISLEEPEESFLKLADDLGVSKEFGKVDFENVSMGELMNIWYSANPASGPEEFAKMILKHVGKPDRLVIDTATTTALYSSRTQVKTGENSRSQIITPSVGDVRIMLLMLADQLRDKGCTVLLLAEAGEGDLFMPEQMLQYICDGKITLKRSSLGTRSPRTLTIEKMRHTNHSLDEQPIMLGKKGIVVEEIEQG